MTNTTTFGWGYGDAVAFTSGNHALTGSQTAGLGAPAPTIAPPARLDDPQTMLREVQALPPLAQTQLAQLISSGMVGKERVGELVQELVRLNQMPQVGEHDIQGASSEIRQAAQEIKGHKEQIAAGEKEFTGMLAAAPVVTLAPATVDSADINNPATQARRVDAESRRAIEEEERRRQQQSGGIGPVAGIHHAAFTAIAGIEAPGHEKLMVADMGPTTAAIAAAVNGFSPTPQIPNLGQARGRETGGAGIA